MQEEQDINRQLREQLTDLLKGGFAPVVILLREFHYDKTGIVLPGLHFSAFSLLGHMQKRQQTLLGFIKDPQHSTAVWEEAHWPQKFKPDDENDWLEAVNSFKKALGEVIAAVDDPETDLYQVRQNGKTVLWAAMALLHHNGYHIGQMKAIGRQLGVW